MEIRCIIVEDEPLALERTKGYLQKLPFLTLLAAFDNATDALVFLQTETVDLIFLDINLGEVSGIRLLETSKINSQVVITTAYPDYAIKGFDLNVCDYLLKPFGFERFVQAVDKVRNNLEKTEALPDKKFIFVKTECRLEKVMLDEILYIEGMRDYRGIHTLNKRIMTLQTFGELEQEIPSHLICRVHKSYMVAIDKIESIEKEVIKIREKYVPISETYKKGFWKVIQGKE
ncbi:LytR/AlgR family response regulator transcription factor [Haliscomenobacter sp.]|uniref:LytR/AlgR family response regulator transcription factor n=1 Tax=Haliscomenobacter sp. TaxID=2717303 RepID=UPI00359308C7